MRETWNRDSLCVTKMTLSINKPREGEDAMIMKDSTTSRSKLSQPAPVFLTVSKEYRLASPLEDNQLPDRPTVQEVARWLRKSPNKIYLWRRQGLIPHKVMGRSKIFDRAHRGSARRGMAAGGVERGYREQLQGVNSAYKLSLGANQLNFAGGMKAAEMVKASGTKAVKLEHMSQIVTTLSRDMVRRVEQATILRF